MQPRIDSAHISLDPSGMTTAADPLQELNSNDELSKKESQKVIRTGNRVKSRPAKDAVISGILSSLQTLEAPQHGVLPNTFCTEDPHTQTTRPQSSIGSLASGPDVPFASFAAVTDNAASPDSDDEFGDNFAAAPSIPTTRTPSGPTPSIRTSSYGAVERSPRRLSGTPRRDRTQADRKSSNRWSSESWVKAGPSTESPQSRRLRRVSSHDTLRPAELEKEQRYAEPDKDFQVDQDFIFNGLAGLATMQPPAHDFTPDAKMLGKARLYLDDNIVEARAKDAHPDNDSIHSFGERSSSPGPSTRFRLSRASRSYAIGDSVPLRTSSLRQASSSPSSSRRISQSQHYMRASSMQRQVSEVASDHAWKDLGEEDGTVKRILELRKKRETRLLDEELRSLAAETLASHDVRGDSSRSPERHHRLSAPTPRPASVQRTSTLLEVPDTSDASHLSTSSNGGPTTGSGDGAHQAARALATTAASSNPNSGSLSAAVQPSTTTAAAAVITTNLRPPTATSNGSADPQFSLDYSYVQAVAALQGAEHELQQRKSLDKPNGMTTIASLQPPQFHRRTTSHDSNTGGSLRPRKLRGRSAYSDVSEETAKRDRRKSMSDVRAGDEKRDSVDDNVLQYLRAPRFGQKIKDAQNDRTISFSEVGDPKGAAVIVCVGMGLTRFVTAFFDELALTLQLRLITIDRPGVGDSSPYADKSGPLMWPADVSAVCEHLGITQFSMLAHSAGAVYALATALILPNMVRGSIHLLAPWIPPSQLEAAPYSTTTTNPAGALPRGQRILRVLPTPFLKAANSSWINMGSLQPAKRRSSNSPSRISSLAREHRKSTDIPKVTVTKRPTTSNGPRPEAQPRESMALMDRFVPGTNPMGSFAIAQDSAEVKRRSSLFLSATATPTDPSFTYVSSGLDAAEHAARERQSDFSTQLTQKTWEYAIKDSNPATDLIVCLERNREIGFRYTDVQRRVIITHGSEDKRVPVANVKWVAEQMSRAAMARAANTRESLALDPGSEPGCEIRILPEEGHGLMASPVIMSDVLTEISGYWTAEERGRFTFN